MNYSDEGKANEWGRVGEGGGNTMEQGDSGHDEEVRTGRKMGLALNSVVT